MYLIVKIILKIWKNVTLLRSYIENRGVVRRKKEYQVKLNHIYKGKCLLLYTNERGFTLWEKWNMVRGSNIFKDISVIFFFINRTEV